MQRAVESCPVNSSPTRLAEALGDRRMIEREVGAGGIATVCFAQDRKHDRKVALKALGPELAEAMGAERFPSASGTTQSAWVAR